MKRETIIYIKSLLFQHKSFVFPGLGVFSLVREPAYFSDNNTTIFPPQYTVQFSDKITTYATIEKEIETELTKVSTFITNTLLSESHVDIEHLGRFYSSYANQIQFIPTQSLIDYFNPGYEPIQNVHQVVKTFAPSSNDFHEVSTESLIYEKPKKIETNVQNKPKINWKLLLILLFVIGLILCFLFCPRPTFEFDYFTPPAQKNKVEQKNDTIQNNIVKNPEISTQLSEADSITLARKNKNLPCAIITGSLKSSVNILKMTEKLNSLGYEVFTLDNDSTTRIGIRYDCNQTSVDALLEKIRSEVVKDAWVLR